MYFAGVDIGSRGVKGVIITEEGQIVSQYIGDMVFESAKTSLMVIDEITRRAGLTLEDLGYIVATGYGRVAVPLADESVSDIAAHTKGAFWYFPSVRTILDIGGQDCKAINCNEKGRVTKFVMNDKCAGGTGRFLEIIADVLEVPFDEIGNLSLKSKEYVDFSTVCAIFAKSKVVALMREGTEKGDILAGLHDAIARQCLSLLTRISIEKDFVMTGGVAKNIGVVEKVKENVGLDILLPPDPQIVAAIGCALFARDRYLAKQKPFNVKPVSYT